MKVLGVSGFVAKVREKLNSSPIFVLRQNHKEECAINET